MKTFTKETLHIDDVVVYIYKTITSGVFKFVGQVVRFDGDKVVIRQLSKADVFIRPEEGVDYGEVVISPKDVVNILWTSA